MSTGTGDAALPRAVARLEISWAGTGLLRDEQELNRLSELVSGALSDRHGPRTLCIGIRFVDAEEMAELNREHMGHEGPTDVLSFPIDGDPIEIAFPDDDEWEPVPGGGNSWQSVHQTSADLPPWMLGDIVICPEVAAANAPTHAGSYEDEMALLVVHGLLHLFGMDHATSDERAAMQAEERELLDVYHGPLARDPWTE